MMTNTPTNPNSDSSERKILSVSQLNRRAKQLLETSLPLVWLEAEISNLSKPGSGHWYFTLKDDKAQIRSAMFKARNNRVKWPVNDGQKVLVRAKVSLFEGRGDYQLIVEHMEEAGIGPLQRAFEALKQQLSDEGLFNAEHKKPLPSHPTNIGLITSATGSVVKDMINVFKRRWPLAHIIILPVPVQGEDAPQAIATAIALANKGRNLEALIVGRGGGSLEDLWAFNTETVARAIFASRLPIISAVGHETDTAISDFVADLRAPTPSAAAELLSPDRQPLLNAFLSFESNLERSITSQLQTSFQALDHLRARLRHPGERLKHQQYSLAQLHNRAIKAIDRQLNQQAIKLEHLSARMGQLHPKRQLPEKKQQLSQLAQRLSRATKIQLQHHAQRVQEAAHLLNNLSPLATLDRGYSLIQNTDKQLIQNSNQLNIGDRINGQLAQGQFSAEITEVFEHSSLHQEPQQ